MSSRQSKRRKRPKRSDSQSSVSGSEMQLTQTSMRSPLPKIKKKPRRLDSLSSDSQSASRKTMSSDKKFRNQASLDTTPQRPLKQNGDDVFFDKSEMKGGQSDDELEQIESPRVPALPQFLPQRLIEPTLRVEFKNKTQVKYCTNKIRTARYTAISFFPVALMVQFTKIGNVFWLANGLLNMFPAIKTNSPFTVLFVLSIVVGVGMFKEFISDVKRWHADKFSNTLKYDKLIGQRPASGENLFDTCCSQDIEVGDIICLYDNQQIPADCVILKAPTKNGLCFISTGQLDGEANLKPRHSISVFQKNFTKYIFNNPENEVLVACTKPNSSLYHFQAECVHFDAQNQERKKYPVSLLNFLPRGGHVRNVGKDGILALVCYTGNDTKIVMNQGNYVYKKSTTDKAMNMIFVAQMISIFAIDIIMTVIGNIYLKINYDNMGYVFIDGEPTIGWQTLYQFFSFWLLLIRFLPLDVIVNVEMGKIFTSKFIECDADMLKMDEKTGELKFCKAQSMQLPEELGQIDYLFCDKTGTLTKNELVFRALSFGGYLCQGKTTETILQQVYSHNSPEAERLFKCFALCHEVMMVPNKDGKMVPSGSSQDELQMLEVAAKSLYFTFHSRDQTSITIKDNQDGKLKKFEILKLFEFSSERKMMSIVVRDSNNKVYAFAKGSDSVMEPLLRMKTKEKMTLDDLDDMAENGLRTMVYAYKEIKSMDTSPEALRTLDPKDVEHSFKLLGVTGVEDSLQDDVAKCISDFKEAGIKTWILTGDKDATALNIGMSCGVFIPDRTVVQIDTFKNLNAELESIGSFKDKDLLLSGQAITQILLHPNPEKIAELLLETDALVVYRSSPSQKAQVVKFVRQHAKGKSTCAIGDGANDVNMIQSAHIGIGLMGKEGNQASSFADFAINQFKDLRRLLFWHGSNFATRLSTFIILIIMKTQQTSIAKIFFNMYTGFSGQQYVTDLAYTMFALPMTSYGFYNFLEHNVNHNHKTDEGTLKFKMSTNYAHQRDINVKTIKARFTLYSIIVYICSACSFFIPFNVFRDITDSSGHTSDVWTVGFITYLLTVVFCHGMFWLHIKDFNKVLLGCLTLSFSFLLLLVGVCNYVPSSEVYRSLIPNLMMNPLFWLTFGIVWFMIMAPFIILKAYTHVIWYPEFNYK